MRGRSGSSRQSPDRGPQLWTTPGRLPRLRPAAATPGSRRFRRPSARRAQRPCGRRSPDGCSPRDPGVLLRARPHTRSEGRRMPGARRPRVARAADVRVDQRARHARPHRRPARGVVAPDQPAWLAVRHQARARPDVRAVGPDHRRATAGRDRDRRTRDLTGPGAVPPTPRGS